MSSKFYQPPDKASLYAKYVNKHVESLPTPSVLIDKTKFIDNSAKMLRSAAKLDATFRCHIKTHKALEGVSYQLGYGLPDDSIKSCSRVVVSTLAEAWSLLPLIESAQVDDVLYGLPVPKSRIEELFEFSKHVKKLRLLVDSISQIEELKRFAQENNSSWDISVKVDMGYGRAGLTEDSESFEKLVTKVLSPEFRKYITLSGLYCHAGNSYSAKGGVDAWNYLVTEVKQANQAAKRVHKIDPSIILQLSVGATPTAHASQQLQSLKELEEALGEKVHGELEIHAGNYPCCDLQQVATGLVTTEDISLFLLAEVISGYEGRNEKSPGESLINAGCIALSRETGPIPGYGRVVYPQDYGKWTVGRLSQEHGILVPEDGSKCVLMPYGTKIVIIPQHACITAAAHAWYFVVEDNKVVDVWVPAKLW